MLWLVITMVFVVILVVFLSRVYHWRREERPSTSIKDLKTGDIIYSTPIGIGRYLFNFGGIQGTHAMMIYKDDKDTYLYHITGYRDDTVNNRRPHFTSLLDQINDKGADEHYTVYKYLGAPISSSQFMAVHDELKEYKFNSGFIKNYLLYALFGIHNDILPNERRVCCGDLVYLTMVKLGLINFDSEKWSDSMRFCQSTNSGMPDYTDFKKIYSSPHDLIIN